MNRAIDRGKRRVSSRVAAVLVSIGYGLVLLAWVFGNPPFTVPDEGIHYLRALQIADGDLIGPKAAYPGDGSSPEQLEWLNRNSRTVEIPGGMSYIGLPECMGGQPDVTAACQEAIDPPRDPSVTAIPNGTYQPFPYAIAGPAALTASDPIAANYRGRLAAGTTSAAMITLAVFFVLHGRPNRGILAAGLAVAVPPMVLFVASGLTPSGLEITSGLAFAAAMVRIACEDAPERWVWVGAGISGLILALSRSPAPLWIAMLLLIPLGVRGWRSTTRVILSNSPWSWIAMAMVVTGVGLNLLWEGLYGPAITVDLEPVVESLSQALGQYSWIIRQQVGIFGILEHGMPEVAYKSWFMMLFVLLIAAFLVGSRRDRLALGVAVTAAVATPTLLMAAVVRHTGFEVQGRHVLVVAMAVPLLASAVLARRYALLGRAQPRNLGIWFVLIAGVVQVVGWLANARRYAVGRSGPIVFFGESQWDPPLGWGPWLVVLLIGVVLTTASIWNGQLMQPKRPRHHE